jgi:hypothetical protein
MRSDEDHQRDRVTPDSAEYVDGRGALAPS